MVGAPRARSSCVTPVRPSLRVIPGGAVSPARPGSSRPSPLCSPPGPEPGFFAAFALAIGGCLVFWTLVVSGFYVLLS
jgi:hypothetical protein